MGTIRAQNEARIVEIIDKLIVKKIKIINSTQI